MDDEVLLQRAWFHAEGLERPPDDRIHPDDDMFREDVLAIERDRRRFSYMRSGYEAFLVLENALRHAGRSLANTPSLLDFAGGYGRLVRFLVQHIPARSIWVSDVLRPAVDYVSKTFDVNGHHSATDPDAIGLDRCFSLIWVGSLFSHLPRHRFGTLLSVLFNALERDGILIFSTHSPEVMPDDAPDASGFTFLARSESRILGRQEYGTTYVEPSIVRDICREQGIEHVWGLERELWSIQDVYAVSAQEIEGLDSWQQAPVARGSITRSEITSDGHAWVGGWVRVPRKEAPVTEVSLVLDEERTIETALSPHSSSLPIADGGDRFRQTDWYVEGPAGELDRGVHTLCAVARTETGLRGCFDARNLSVP